MLKAIKSYLYHLTHCFNFEGEMTNKEFYIYIALNAIIMSSLAAFVMGIFDGFMGLEMKDSMFVFYLLYGITTFGVVIKKIKYDMNKRMK